MSNIGKKPEDRSVVRQINDLQRMSMPELRKKWKDLFGTEAGRLGRNYLIRRLAYRIQEIIYGGLSREAKRRLTEIHQNPDSKRRPTKREITNLQIGTRLIREWHGERYEVVVDREGFVFDGKTYRSLSAVARAITGTHRGGRRFFGLEPADKRGGSSSE
ncbi:MAG: DUF2924 domain-containing protein [Pirellulaceae bacterium]